LWAAGRRWRGRRGRRRAGGNAAARVVARQAGAAVVVALAGAAPLRDAVSARSAAAGKKPAGRSPSAQPRAALAIKVAALAIVDALQERSDAL
jgi:hypothetical protein